jgi:hypothetical protein
MKAWIITRYDHVKRVAGLFGYLRFSVHTGVACAAHFFSGPFALHQAGRRRQSRHPSAMHRRHARGARHDRRQDIHRGGEGAAAAAARFGFAPVLVCVAPCAAILRAADGEEAWAGDGMFWPRLCRSGHWLPLPIFGLRDRIRGQSRSSTTVDTVASWEPMKPPQKGQSRPNTVMPSLRRPATVP